LNNGSCVRFKPEYKGHFWSYGSMVGSTNNGRAFRILNIIDEFTRERLSIKVAPKISSQNAIDEVFILFILLGILEHIRFDNGPELSQKH
jgi:putative transposase